MNYYEEFEERMKFRSVYLVEIKPSTIVCLAECTLVIHNTNTKNLITPT